MGRRLWAALLALCVGARGSGEGGPRLNVLLVVVDDLRTELASYGSRNVRTPAFDKLAREGVQFDRAYAAEAICGPARAAVLTAKMPHRLDAYFVHDNPEQERRMLSGTTMMTRHFMDKHYEVLGASKVVHWVTNNERFFSKYHKLPSITNRGACGQRVVCGEDADESERLTDAKALRWSKNQIDRLAEEPDKPWMMVVGFRRPHTTFRVPDRVLAGIDVDKVELAPPEARTIPPGAPWQAHRPMCEDLLSSREVFETGFHEPGPLQDQAARKLRQGYFASIEWIDELVGELLEHLDAVPGMREKTLVVVTSDHGWLLGEHGAWCKGSLRELALHTPLFIRDPESARRGERESRIVQGIDLFPTIAELAGVPLPADVYADDDLDGRSFAHVLRPDVPTHETVREVLERIPHAAGQDWAYPVSAAFSVWPICVAGPGSTVQVDCRICRKNGRAVDCSLCGWNDCDKRAGEIDFLGVSVRTTRWRYTEWRSWDAASQEIDWSEAGLSNAELYGHAGADGADSLELKNKVLEHPGVASRHASMLQARLVPCQGTNANECAALGQHCAFADGRCRSRAFCDFRGRVHERRALCAERDDACEWDPDTEACVNKFTGGRLAVAEVVPSAAPTMSPSRPPLPGGKICRRISDPAACDDAGCSYFRGTGCRPQYYCGFDQAASDTNADQCDANPVWCRWLTRKGRCKKMHWPPVA